MFNIPKKYKQNTIKVESYIAKGILSIFTNKIALIRCKVKSTDHLMCLVNSVLCEFTAVQEIEDSEFIIPFFLAEVKKK